MIKFRFLILIILFFSSVSQLAGQTTGCTKAKMRELIQKGFSNKEIDAACNETSKTEEERSSCGHRLLIMLMELPQTHQETSM